jgi:secretion/DNA translocation related TadE-like protein
VSRDRGSVTVWAAALAGLIWLSSSAALLYGAAVVGRHRAETAADLAALAAAVHVPDGDSAACALAASVAARNGAELRSCRVLSEDVEVQVSRRVGLGGLGTRGALARARAGPVEAGPVEAGP